jgi:hypothetical protein
MAANILANNRTPKLWAVGQKKKFYAINNGNNHKAYYEGRNIKELYCNSLTPI